MRSPGGLPEGNVSRRPSVGFAVVASAGSRGVGLSVPGGAWCVLREGDFPGPSRCETDPGIPAREERKRRRDAGRTTSEGGGARGRSGWFCGGEAEAQGLPGDALREEGGRGGFEEAGDRRGSLLQGPIAVARGCGEASGAEEGRPAAEEGGTRRCRR